MSKRMSILLVVLTVISGLIGGAVTGRIFTPKVAIAAEATQSKVLTVEGLRVVDKDGKLLMVLGKVNKNTYGLAIYDNSGGVGVVVDVDENGGSVGVHDKDGKAGAGISVDKFGGIVSVHAKDEGGASIGVNKYGGIICVIGKEDVAANMSVDEDGGHVSIAGKDGEVEAGIGVIEVGGYASGYVEVYDKDYQNRAKMSVGLYGGCFDIYGKGSDKPRATMQVNEYGYGAIGLWDKDGYRLK